MGRKNHHILKQYGEQENVKTISHKLRNSPDYNLIKYGTPITI